MKTQLLPIIQRSKVESKSQPTPTFIHWQQVRDKWNNLQRSHGLLDRYYKTTGHYNANSTDIHKVKSIKNLSSYLVKYITKQYQNETSLGGKVWDCSNNLRGAKYFNCLFNDNHKLFIKYAVDSKLATEYIDERFTLIKFKEDVQEFILDETELKNYYSFMEIIRDKPSSTINF